MDKGADTRVVLEPMNWIGFFAFIYWKRKKQ